MPFWFTQIGIIAVAFSLLISLFGVVDVVKYAIGVGAVVLIYHSFTTLYQAFGPKIDEGLEEFLEELGLADDQKQMSAWEVQRNLLLIVSSIAILVFIVGHMMLMQLIVSALALFVLWTASSDLFTYLSYVLGFDLDDGVVQTDPDGPDIAGFSQFDPAKH